MVDEQVDQSQSSFVRSISVEKDPIHSFPKPVIPPLWEVLGIPGPIKEPNSMQLAQSKVIEAEYVKIQENETLLGKRNITENVKIPRDLDQWTDDQFRTWRKNNPRESEEFMMNREKEILEMPIQRQSEYFLNTILNDYASDLLSSTSESDSETCSGTSESSSDDYHVTQNDNDFVRAYNNLFTRWINLHR